MKKPALHLEDDRMCYVCGKDNTHGFRLDFSHPKKNHMFAEVVFQKYHQGYKGIVHGGILAMMLDEIMINLAWKEGLPAVTADLGVRLKKAAKIGHKVRFEGFIDRVEGRAVYAHAAAHDEEGRLLATAQATCIRIKTAPDTA